MSNLAKNTAADEQQISKGSTSLWFNRDFLLLWSGQASSSVGIQVSQLAMPLLVLALTESPVQAGLVGTLRILPYAFLSLPAGVFIDRWDRKRIMILCGMGRAIAIGSIPIAFLLGYLTIGQLYIVSLLEGAFFVFFNIAEDACLPKIVSRDQLGKATAQNQAIISVSYILGPMLGGILYSIRNVLPFLMNAILYTISMLLLFYIKGPFQEERTTTSRKLGKELKEGLEWFWHQPLIRYIALLSGGTNIVWASAPLILIVQAKHLGASPFETGLMFTVGGIGGIAGAIFAPIVQRNFGFRRAITVIIWIWAIVWPIQAIAPHAIILALLMACTFFTAPIYDVILFSYRSKLTPDNLQGRVNSVFRLVAVGMQPASIFIAGILLQVVGPVFTIVLFTIPFFTFALTTSINPYLKLAGMERQ